VSDLHTNGTANRAPTGVQDDIVERLQRVARANGCEAGRGCSEAADEIERLRTLVANMADAIEWCGCGDDDPDALVADTERTAAIRALVKEARRA
jgi:hypothetical protein